MNKIILSRTDNIGDVILTLPMVYIIKEYYPNSRIIFLGKSYTAPIISLCPYIDEFLNYDDFNNLAEKEKITTLKEVNADTIIHVFPRKELAMLAKKAKIKDRIGTSHRYYHLLTCNRLITFSRKRSKLHESQLNLKLLAGIKIEVKKSINELCKLNVLTNIKELPKRFHHIFENKKKNLILHPKSKGSAIEWGIKNFNRLISILPENKFNIFITGTEEEGNLIQNELVKSKNIYNLTGQMTLQELISFIRSSDFLLACSTGPLHIAASVGIHTLGIFSKKKPMHPERWRPIGKKVKIFTYKNASKLSDDENIKLISPKMVADYIESLLN